MKKMNNKGFSLVELIIVIAIMAILAGAIAPALIRYIDKSRKSNDVSSCKTIKTAVETAMGNERTYELLVNGGSGSSVTIQPNVDSTSTGAVAVVSGAGDASAAKEIGLNIGEKTPKFKYTKNKPDHFKVLISSGGTVKVFIVSSTGTEYEVCPELCDEYQ